MAERYRAWLKGLDRRVFDVDGGTVTCWFGPKGASRKHVVRVHDTDDGIRFEATVATARTLDRMVEDPARWVWRRNRDSDLVGFRVVGRCLVAEAVAPLIGLTRNEFLVYLQAVAAEADRMELVLTGKDVQ